MNSWDCGNALVGNGNQTASVFKSDILLIHTSTPYCGHTLLYNKIVKSPTKAIVPIVLLGEDRILHQQFILVLLYYSRTL